MSENSKQPPKTMLIIKSNAASLATVETFLRNRGWKIFSTENLKDAMFQLVQGKPSYVLISVDHPNKKIRALPKILTQAFPVAVISFAEIQNAISYKMLAESSSEYRVYPPVTGPAIERCVHKYLKDQQTRESLKNANSEFKYGTNNSSANKAGGLYTIEGKGAANDSSQNVENTNFLLSQIFNEEPVGAPSANSANKSDSGLIFAQSLEEKESTSAAAYMPETSANDNLDLKYPGSVTQEGPAGPLLKSPKSVSRQNDDLTALPTSERAESPEGSPDFNRVREKANPGWVPAAENVERNNLLHARQERSETNQTLIAKGTHQALTESVDNQNGNIREKIEHASNMACIIVQSERFSGYLVAVMGNNQTIDPNFITTIKERLFKFLNENGEKVSEDEAMGLKVKQVEFEPWALEYADFLRKSVHKGNEVAMAFFPRRPPKVILEESQHHDMAKVQLGDLVGDRPIEFDLYMYLPNNNKYVLYTPKGGVFYNRQLERLKNQGITHMHVQKDAAGAVAKYKAQNYLNDLVDDYDQKSNSLFGAKPKAS